MTKKKKKPFKDTLVGSSLIGLASVINPTLGGVLKGATSIGEAIEQIGQSGASPEEKIMLQEFALRQFEAEVQDRASARNRELVVAASGGSDILFKSIGWTIALTFVGMIGGAIGLYEINLEGAHKDLYNIAFGAVTAKMTSIVSYYFGSSTGSKEKTQMMNQ